MKLPDAGCSMRNADRSDFPPRDASTAAPGDDAIDVSRIILNPNWSTNRDAHAIDPAQPARGDRRAGPKTGPA